MTKIEELEQKVNNILENIKVSIEEAEKYKGNEFCEGLEFAYSNVLNMFEEEGLMND